MSRDGETSIDPRKASTHVDGAPEPAVPPRRESFAGVEPPLRASAYRSNAAGKPSPSGSPVDFSGGVATIDEGISFVGDVEELPPFRRGSEPLDEPPLPESVQPQPEQSAVEAPPVALVEPPASGGHEPFAAASDANDERAISVAPATPRKYKTWPFEIADAIASIWEWCLGAVSMIFLLSALSTIPILQILSLGYLLEVVGRMVRTGKFSAGFVGIRTFARIGTVFFGTWAMLIPLRVVADFSYSAHLIAPGSQPSRFLGLTLLVCMALGIVNIVMAWAAGGRLRHFFWFLFAPLFFGVWITRAVLRLVLKPTIESQQRSWFSRFADDLTYYHPLTTWFPPAVLLAAVLRGRPYSEARDGVWNFVASLRLPYYFWLGLRGFVGTIIWLAFPVILLMGGARLPVEAGVWSALLGGILFGLVMLYLPFLQAHFAAENRFRAMFDVFAVRRAFARAPFLFWCGIFLTLALALPLYLLKIEMPPHEFGWVESVFFVAMMYPARLLTGWAMTRGVRREQPRFFLFRWTSRLALVPIAAIYSLFVFLTQYFCWYGSWSLFEQHAVLVPTPFLSF